MKKVLVFGTFDGIHDGHRNFFSQAKEYGDHLVVVVSRDETVESVCGEHPKHDEVSRVADLLLEDDVDDVVMGFLDDKERVLAENKPDTIVLGFTQASYEEDLKQIMKEYGIDVTIVIAESYLEDEYKPSGFNDQEIYVD